MPAKDGSHYYVVQPGDTMWLIARKFGVSLEALLKANPQVTDGDKISIGEKIFIPQGSGGSGGSGGSSAGGTYTVRAGDTTVSYTHLDVYKRQECYYALLATINNNKIA